MSIILALDTSGSVAGERLSHLVDAAKALIAGLRAGDRAALLTFTEEINLRVPLTSDLRAFAPVLDALRGGGRTAVRDAVYTTLQFRPDDESRPIVLL